MTNHHPQSKIAPLAISLCTMFLLPVSTQAAPVTVTPPANCPAFDAKIKPAPGVVTATTISQTGLTNPSLWWANDQFGDRLLNNWCAYPAEQRIDLVVNRQLWSLLTYLERYGFVNHFGTVAREYRYQMRVFTPQKALLATYTCDFSTSPLRCNLWMEGASGEGFQRSIETWGSGGKI